MTLDGDHALLAYDDLPPGVVVAPLPFERAASGATEATDWEPNRLYTVNDSDTPCAEMKAIFDEDQRVRAAGKFVGTPDLGRPSLCGIKQSKINLPARRGSGPCSS